MANAPYYFAFCAANVIILKEVNRLVYEPYMDEPFHVPQAQAYCQGQWDSWDPKITTPPGLYIMSVALMTLLSLPLLLSRLMSFQRRVRPPQEMFSPTLDSITLSMFPIVWFFGFLYYTDVPSLAFVLATFLAALQEKYWLSALLGIVSCTFRQTNIIWVLYSFAYSQLRLVQIRNTSQNDKSTELYDPPASSIERSDWFRIIKSSPEFVKKSLHKSIPFLTVVVLFSIFVYWNGGIVLGDKSNHIPSIHIPQLYYLLGFTTMFGWPVLISGPRGFVGLLKDVHFCMFGTKNRAAINVIALAFIAITVHLFTIHHPFLLSDNRHYTFYIWRRVFRLHSLVPYLLSPVYLACAWAWFIRLGAKQTILQTLVLPLFAIPTLLLTPLLEPRYFLIPYVLLRIQVMDVPDWSLWLETVWYAVINWMTMYVFLYKEREGGIRFMW